MWWYTLLSSTQNLYSGDVHWLKHLLILETNFGNIMYLFVCTYILQLSTIFESTKALVYAFEIPHILVLLFI